jgi:hypothetical protein
MGLTVDLVKQANLMVSLFGVFLVDAEPVSPQEAWAIFVSNVDQGLG